MLIELRYADKGGSFRTAAKGPIHGLKLGHKILTPRNLGFEIQSVSPRDAASGLPSGKRQHSPLTITTESDGSHSLLSGLSRNQAFAKVVLYFWNTNGRGKPETLAHTVELTNAEIASYKRIAGGISNPEQSPANRYVLEECQFAFGCISVTNSGHSKSTSDNWLAG
jgi:type VI secretion system secreted protein Hcp